MTEVEAKQVRPGMLVWYYYTSFDRAGLRAALVVKCVRGPVAHSEEHARFLVLLHDGTVKTSHCSWFELTSPYAHDEERQ